MNSKSFKIILIALLALLLAYAHMAGLTDGLTLENIRAKHEALLSYYQGDPWIVVITYFVTYVIITAFSLPGAAILTLAGGALFGFWLALLIVSFASTIGATLAFLISRYMVGSWVQTKYEAQLKTFNEGFVKEGLFYLFAMRLTPIFPFFLINILMGLTPVRVRCFYVISQIGMLPGTAAFVFAGTELGKLSALSDVLSVPLILAFTVLGFLPIITKKIISSIRARRAT